jgi:hypothetical protein
MARVKKAPPAEPANGPATEKAPASDRTIGMFDGKTTEERNAEIKRVQDDALSRVMARAAFSPSSPDDVAMRKDLDDERAAIQAEERSAPPAATTSFVAVSRDSEKIRDRFVETCESLLDGRGVPARPEPAVSRETTNPDEGETISYTKGEEMYGKTGFFSSYRVGPFTETTKVRPGETKAEARRRLAEEVNAFADEERERSKAKFMGHLPNAFQATAS